MLAERFIERGMSPEEARVAARRRFGNRTLLHEARYEMQGFAFLENIARDVRRSARAIGRNKGFAAVAVLTLAVGIGANTALFTVANALLLRPFPYRDPERIVSITNRADKDYAMSLPRYESVRDNSQSFESIAIWTTDNLNLTGHGEPMQTSVARVSPNFLWLLGVRPQLGRGFTEEEGNPRGRPVVILSDTLWRSRFGGDRGVVGQTIALDNTAYTIVGVMPADVTFPFVGPVDLWAPRYFEYSLMSPERLRTGVGYLSMIARLRPHVSKAQADVELAMLSHRYRERNPGAPDETAQLSTVPLRDLVVSDLRAKVLVLWGAVGVVLLIACANVASLLLSRVLARRGEIAVRAALGASRGAVVRQVLIESVLVALIGGALGLILSVGASRALTTWGASQLPRGVPLSVDWSVPAFTLGMSILTGIIFGALPALQVAGVDPGDSLREGGRGVLGGRGRVRSALVVAQVSLALLLLVGAGLLVRSFANLLRVDPGFDPSNLLTMDISLPSVKYRTGEQQTAFFDEMLRRTAAVPGVRSAAISAALPLAWIRITPLLPEGQPNVPLAQRPFLDIEAVSPGWFETMRVPLRAGRTFTDADRAGAPKVVIANESFAKRFWPGDNPIGKHVIVGRGPDASEVVGVAADVRNRGLVETPQAQLWLPFKQLPWGNMNLLVRTAVEPRGLAKAVRAQIAAVDPDEPVTKTQTAEDLMDAGRAQTRFVMLLLGAFSGTAFVLAGVGLYGVLAYSVAQRRQELGIRVALGAGHPEIAGLVVRQGLWIASTGIAIGLICAPLLTRLMPSMLFKTGAHDPITFVLAPVLFLAVAVLASWLPARRAAKLDAMEALRVR